MGWSSSTQPWQLPVLQGLGQAALSRNLEIGELSSSRAYGSGSGAAHCAGPMALAAPRGLHSIGGSADHVNGPGPCYLPKLLGSSSC